MTDIHMNGWMDRKTDVRFIHIYLYLHDNGHGMDQQVIGRKEEAKTHFLDTYLVLVTELQISYALSSSSHVIHL